MRNTYIDAWLSAFSLKFWKKTVVMKGLNIYLCQIQVGLCIKKKQNKTTTKKKQKTPTISGSTVNKCQ